MNNKSKELLFKIAHWLIPLLISVFAIWLILRNIDLTQFISNLSKIGLIPLLLSSLVFFASLIWRVLCWYILLRRKVSFKDAFFTMNAGYLLNNIFPLRLGEVGRAILLSNPSGPSALEAFSSVIVERVFDVFLAAVFIIGLLPRILVGESDQTLYLVAFISTLIGIAGLYLLAKYRLSILNWLENRGKRVNFINRWVIPKATQLLEGFSVLNNPGAFLLSIGSLFVSWILAFVQNFIIFSELYPDPPFWWLIFVLSAGAFGLALPSAPAGLGIFEGATIAAFALLGVDAGTALAHAIVIHGMSFVYNNILGLVGLQLKGEALVSLYKRAVRRSPEKPPTE